MPGGQSHNARFFPPYPFYTIKARGKYLWDVDGNRYTDYWMGHTALILGHSPSIVTRILNEQIDRGLLFGTANKYATDLAELVMESVPAAENLRFCTSGAEATMYAMRLARAFTNRRIILKMGGGWHGYNSLLSVGVSAPYKVPESLGLVPDEEKFTKLVSFNDIETTRRTMKHYAADIAAVIIEPVMGAGGVLPAQRDYLQFLREECDKIGCLLVFDEIITGFRLALGGAQEYYRVRPDICTLGKILGGGLPASAVAGRKDVLELVDTTTHSKSQRCWIGGGTFSENALAMRAGIATLQHLRRNKSAVYRTINSLGETLRREVDRTFLENGVRTKTTGVGSLFCTHFLSTQHDNVTSPSDVDNTDKVRQKEYYFSLITNEKIFFLPGHIGAISSQHSTKDIEQFMNATARYACVS